MSRERWTPGLFVTFGILAILFFGVPGITRSIGNDAADVLLAIGGAVGVVWVVIGIVGFGVRAGRSS